MPNSRKKEMFCRPILGLLIISGFLLAGTTPKLHTTHKINTNQPVIKKDTNADSSKNVIQGHVFAAKTKKPLPAVTFLINKKRTGLSRANGGFKLTVPDSLLDNQIVLSTRCIGFKEMSDTINRDDLPVNKEYWLYRNFDSSIIVCAIARAEWFYHTYNPR